MCNWKKWIWPGILAVGLLAIVSLMWKSASIEQDLTAKAGSALSAQHGWASVELDGRDATLKGIAPSEDARAEALQLADNAYDVRVIADGSELLALADPFKVVATKADGKVVLDGNVASDADRAAIIDAAKLASPGAEIVDNMTLARGVPAGFLGLASYGIGQLTGLETGTASLSNMDLTVTGNAPSFEVYTGVNEALANLPEGGKLASADIQAPQVSPYTLTATKGADTIVLDGYYPSEDVRSSIVSAAQAANPGKTVTDNLKFALGAPEGFGTLAGFGIGQLNGLTSGTANLSDLALGVKGIAPTSDVYKDVTSTLAGTLPANGSLAMADITPPTASPYTFAAIKGSDSITLNGFVPSDAIRSSLISSASNAYPGKTVVDNMNTAIGAPAGFEALASFGVSQLTTLESGTASLSDLDLSVIGVASSSSVFENVTGALNGDLPGEGKLAKADITTPTASPYVFAANKDADSVVLTGFYPSSSVRSALNEAAQKANPGKTVVDNLKFALGAPVGFEALASFGMGQLTTLDTGKASTNDLALSVEGFTASSNVFDSVTGALNGDLPGEGKLASANITGPVASPYPFSAVRSSDSVVLTGSYPSTAVRKALNLAAENSNRGKKIIDQLTFAQGAPAGFQELASFGMSQLTSLDSGTASTSDLNLSVVGVASSSNVYETVTGALNGALPAGGKLAKADITGPSASPYIVEAVKSADSVTLTGFYPSSAVRSAIVDGAKKAHPGKKVVDNLKFALGAPAGFQNLAEFGIGQLDGLVNGTASLSDTNLSVKGLASTIRSYNGVNAALDGTLPSNGKLAMKDITPPTANPYVLSAIESNTGVVLQGYVPDEATRGRLVAAAKSTTPTGNVTDQMQIASGSPAGFADVADFGIAQLGDLVSGEVSLTNLDLSVRGISANQAGYDKVTSVLAGSVPAKGKVVLADISRHTVKPYTFTAVRNASSIILSGYVETPAQKSAAVASATAKNAGLKVIDQLQLANGVPAGVSWPGATELAIDEVSQLRVGQANVTDNMYRVEGMAMTNAKYDAVVAEANGKLPAGLKLAKEAVRKPPAPKPAPKPKPKPAPKPKPLPKPVDFCQIALTDEMKSNKINFETNKAVIVDTSYPLLDRLVNVLKSCPTASVEIGGHTDSTGSSGYNQGLSEARANAVRSYLESGGVAAGRLNAVGYGEDNPIADNNTNEGRAANRRIEFNVTR